MAKKRMVANNVHHCTPSLNDVVIYFDQKGLVRKAAEAFFKTQQQRKWKTEKGLPIRSWKTVANNWIWMHQVAARPQTIEVKLKLQLPALYQTGGNG